jgi:hypothetical protein
MASATGRDRTPRSALGPCRNGPLSASAVTNGRERFGGTAGRRPSSSGAAMMRAGDSDCGPEGQQLARAVVGGAEMTPQRPAGDPLGEPSPHLA